MAPGRPVSALAEAVGGDLAASGDDDPVISDVTHDSQMAGPGILFVAIEGETADGHRFVPDAVVAGSPAVCVARRTHAGIPEIVVGDTRAVLGPLAATVHGHPSHALRVVGVTGTNGK
ncbi:MAG: hypothetical protein KY394_04570, partial [Actinobacteria bacterium]|nr:hypothetical protein [Actinomycetota bacterium]